MNVQDQSKGTRERTLDEVKAEFMRRAGKLNPFEDIKREDAEKVMAALKSLDKDHWADEWCKIGLIYEAKADALAKTARVGDALIADLRKQMAEDNVIFDNKVHIPSPALIDADGPILPFRRWAERFYPEPDPTR